MTEGAAVVQLSRRLAPLLVGPPDQCMTVSVAGDASRWLQYVDGQINAATAASSQPDALIDRLGDAEVVAFEAGKYLTAYLALNEASAIAVWIVDYFRLALGTGDDPVLDTTVESL